jgi:hypothetical protein
MDNIEKKLINFPKARISRTAGLKIRFRIVFQMFVMEMGKAMHVFTYKMTAASALAAALLLIVILPAYSYESDSVGAGDLLYPLKRAMESARLGAARSPEEKSMLYEKFAQRRIKEADEIVREDFAGKDEILPLVVDDYTQLRRKAEQEIAKIGPDAGQAAAAKKLEESDAANSSALSGVARLIGPRQSERSIDSIAQALDQVAQKSGTSSETGLKEARMKGRKANESTPAKPGGSSNNAGDAKGKSGAKSHSGNNDGSADANRDGEEEEAGKAATSSSYRPRGSDNQAEKEGDFQKREEGKDEDSADYEDKIKQEIADLKEDIQSFQDELSEEDYDADDIESLIGKLEKRADLAQKALEQAGAAAAEAHIRSAKTLMRNGRHFLRLDDAGRNGRGD